MITPVRRRLAVVAMVLLVPALGACTYQTNEVYQPSVGTNVQSGTVDILGAAVVSGTDGSGTFIATLVNKSRTESATLTSITGPEGVEVQLAKPVDIAPDTLVNLADLGLVGVSGEPIAAGNFVELTLTFDTGQTTKVNTTVVDRDLQFSQVPPAIPVPSPSQ